MKHLKLYEDFDANYFSSDYEELTSEEFAQWREGWLQGHKYLVWDDDRTRAGFYTQIVDLLKSMGRVSVSPEFVHDYDGTTRAILKALICLCEETQYRILIRPFEFDGVGFMVSIFGPDANPRDYTQAMGHFQCYENEVNPLGSLEQLLRDKAKEGLFTKAPKTPKAYKSEPTLTDVDFEERGMDNQMRSQFYKERGKVVRDLSREEALNILDEWATKR